MSEPSRKLVEKAYDLDEIRKSLEDAAKVSGGVWLSYLFVYFYVGTAVMGVTHADLLLERPVKLPFLNTELPLVTFFFFAPVLFLISHVYTLIHFAMLATKATRFDDELTSGVPDKLFDSVVIRDRVRWLLPSNIFVQFLAGPEFIRKGALENLLKMIAWTTLVIGPILLLVWSQVRFLPYHSEFITGTHRLIIALDVLLVCFILWPMVLGGRSETNWPRSVDKWASAAYFVTVLFSLTVATFPGEQFDYLFGKWNPLHIWLFSVRPDPDTGRPTSYLSNRLMLSGFDALEAAKIDDPKKLDNIKQTVVLRGRHLESAIFDRADLRKADLEGAQLQGASLDHAQLQGASLDHTQLQGARLDHAQLQGASFDGAVAWGANLRGAQLQSALLEDAELQGAQLGFAELQGASLVQAKLQGADLSEARLQGAMLQNAQLQGADLSYARLSGADLTDVQLQGADLSNATFKATYLRRTYLWRAQLGQTSFDKIMASDLVWDQKWWDLGDYRSHVDVKPWTEESYSHLAKEIAEKVPETKDWSQLQTERAATLKRIEILNPSKPFADEPKGPDWRRRIEAATVDEEDYKTALVEELRSLVCSGDDDTIDIVRGLIRQGPFTSGKIVRLTRPQAPALIESILAPDCPVSAALTEQDKAALKRIAKEASGAH